VGARVFASEAADVGDDVDHVDRTSFRRRSRFFFAERNAAPISNSVNSSIAGMSGVVRSRFAKAKCSGCHGGQYRSPLWAAWAAGGSGAAAEGMLG